jgi:hypothetical protein
MVWKCKGVIILDSIVQKYEYYFTDDIPIPFIPQSIIDRSRVIIDQLNIMFNEEELTEEQINIVAQYEEELKILNEKIFYITPIYMNNYLQFFSSIGCLTIEKNKISDPKIISMSYLDFLFYLIENDENRETYGQMFLNIIKLSLNIEEKNMRYIKNEKGKITLKLNDVEFNKKDFDELRRIICYQNMPDYNDEYIDPELEEALKEVEKLQNKNQGICTLEDQKICVSISSPYKLEDINKLTIRKFVKILKKIDAKLHYQIYKTGECSGMISFKTPLNHWMYEKDARFDSLISYDSFKEKMKQVT